jgi:hypothetical protein
MVENSGTDVPAEPETTIPNVARVYDYLLGGKENFATDRELGRQLMEAFPQVAWIARQNRAFLGRAVRYCAQQGISQFLDVGSGLPTMDNVHEVARRVIPAATVVYVDNDRTALSHAQSLLGTSDGVTAIFGDLREPRNVLAGAAARGGLDLGKPVAVLLASVLHFIADHEDPGGIVAVFREAMTAGSYLVLTHASHDDRPAEAARARDMYRGASSPLATRSYDEVAAFFAGLELAPPGLVRTSHWRPEEQVPDDQTADLYAGVGRKP